MFAKRLILLVTGLALSACTPAELAGRILQGSVVAAQGLFISDVDEIKIGQQTLAKVLSQMPEHPNPELRDYISAVGSRLAALSERKNLTYSFRVVESKDVNAFAAPGGFLFITTAALRHMKNEAQLAGVLGHEVAHVDRKHSIHAIQRALVAQGVATAVLSGNNNQLAELGSNIAATLVLKGFGREDELESDRLGAEWAHSLRYDARELGSFLTTLKQLSGETSAWMEPLADHPRTSERIELLHRHFAATKMDFSAAQLGEAEYQQRVLALLGPAPAPAGPASP